MWPCARGLLGAGPGGLLPQSLALEKEYRVLSMYMYSR